MDNRWIFLYCMAAELRGRMGVARAGRGETGTSTQGGVKEKPYTKAQGVKWSERK